MFVLIILNVQNILGKLHRICLGAEIAISNKLSCFDYP